VKPSSSAQRAFEGVFDRYSAEVAAYLRRRASPEEADDVFAETFLVAWRRFDAMPAQPLPWLYGIARRALANHFRGRRRQAALMERLKAFARIPDEGSRANSETSHVLDALRRLSSSDQEILMLVAWENLRPEEAAAVLGCSAGAFRVRLHRARKHMARQLRRRGGSNANRAVIEEV
jgi:RNA polymerase sigma-70 factor, ECF subfamily